MGLICLDLDGTLIADALVEVETGSGGTKLERRQHERFHEPQLLEGRFKVLQTAALEGDRFAIVTNQGGVAWGYHTQAEVFQRIGATLAQLQFFWGRPFSVHVAFMHPRATVTGFKGDDGRKPDARMIAEAVGWHDLAPDSPPAQEGRGAFDHQAPVIMVGDRDEDRQAAEAAGVDFALAEDFFS